MPKPPETRLIFIFRNLNAPVPDNWIPGMHWQIEAHDPKWDLPYPVGLAWVTAGGAFPASLDFILVPDAERRNGVATALLAACRKRWPDLWLTEGISDAGIAFLASLPKLKGD